MSCCLVFGFDAVLAGQAPQPFQLAAEALNLFGQGRQVRVAASHWCWRAVLPASSCLSRSRSDPACSKSWESMADSLSRRTCAICSSRSAVAGPLPLPPAARSLTGAPRSRSRGWDVRGHLAWPQPAKRGLWLLALVAKQELDHLLAHPVQSAPSLTSTWAATPSPSRIGPAVGGRGCPRARVTCFGQADEMVPGFWPQGTFASARARRGRAIRAIRTISGCCFPGGPS